MVDSFLPMSVHSMIMVDLSIALNTRKNLPPFLFKISQHITDQTIAYDVG